MIARAVALMLAAGALLSPLPAAAHRGHAALSVVEIDARTGAVTVSHRLQTHDAEPALAVIAPDAQSSLDDPDAVKAITAYVGSRFTLAVEGVAVDLALKEVTLGADEVRLVYAGRIAPKDAGGLIAVQAVMFGDVYGDQANQVNVRRFGVTRTLVFQSEDTEPQTLSYP